MVRKNRAKLNIAIVTNNYTPYSGGVVSSIDSFVKGLHKQGHKAFIITLDFLGKEHNDPYYVIRIPSIYRFMYKKNHMAAPLHMTKKLQKIITLLNPDIIHTQHPFFIGKSALTIARQLHLPIVFTYHTIYERYLHYLPVPQFITRPIVKRLVLSFCKNVDGVIVPSNYIQHYLKQHEIKTTIEKIPSGILPVFIKHQVADQTNSTCNLLTVGRFVKEKNIPFLLHLFLKLHKIHPGKFTFTLVGYGPEYEPIQRLAYKKLKLPKTAIQFIHKPSKIDIADLYYESDLFLFSSTSDTQGLVLAEAMGGGCPAIAIDGPGQRDIIKNGKNGFLCKSEQQMLEKIVYISNNRQLLGKMKKASLETAQQYHPMVTTDRLISFYEDTIQKKANQQDGRQPSNK